MGHLDSHVISDRALFARQSCAVGKRIPLRLQRASYRANNWVTTAQNWCRGSATEIGRKTAKTARDAKMFDATECWEYVATVYRDILPGKFGWIAVHWIMLESAQNWSPNGMSFPIFIFILFLGDRTFALATIAPSMIISLVTMS